jgi:hypothetical protein
MPNSVPGPRRSLGQSSLLSVPSVPSVGAALPMAAEPQWQELLRFRLAERNAKESAYSHIIEQCTGLVCWTAHGHSADGYVAC